MARRYLGAVAGVLTRTRVYLASDAVEVDEIEGYTGTRRRVLLDEVLLITLDRRREWARIVFWMAMGLLPLAPFLLIAVKSSEPAALGFGLAVAAPFLLVATMHMVLGADSVVLFGKRGAARVSFAFRKSRAREVFALLRDRVQQVQDQRRAGDAGAPPAGDGSTSAA